jgi:hypothetical protein
LASQVDICNLALSHLGDEAQVASITPPHDSEQASHCARFYPIALPALLEMHPWTFATKREEIAELEDNPAEGVWSHAYSLPSTCIRPLSLLSTGAGEYLLSTDGDAGTHPYVVEAADDGSKILYTNVEGATLRYIDLVSDTTKFTPLFVVCFSRLLASYLAGPIIKGREGRAEAQGQMKMFEAEYAKATSRNANVGRRDGYMTRRPEWLAGRGTPQLPEGYVLREGE